MSGRIPQSFLDDLLLRVDIVDLIDTQVPLKKTGSNFVARCPFHSEKTPSFSVNRSKQFFYCFGCGASGNAIGFLMDYHHLDFVEAVEDLASIAGVEVPRENAGGYSAQQEPGNASELYAVLKQVAGYYARQLRESPEGEKAIAYFKGRGLSGDVAKDYLLGYAPNSWNGLERSFNQQQLQDAGMLVNKEDGGSYHRFRGRVMFPIRDKRGRVVGFGGRVLDSSLPKYLNSPETVVFHKGREIYGLYELLEKNNKPERILLVEGYMDVIALAQFGVHYAVAALGTATSKQQLEMLFRYSKKLVFCFDGDAAGRKAAWRAMEGAIPCLRDGREVRIMLLPQGGDPDSLLREEGVNQFTDRLSSAQTLSDYFFSRLSSGLNLNDIEGQVGLVDRAKPYLEKLPEGLFREKMLGKLKKLARMDVLQHDFSVPDKLHPRNRGHSLLQRYKTSPAQTAIALLLQYPELVEVVEKKSIDWSSFELPGIDLFLKIVHRIQDNPKVTLPGLVEGFRREAEYKHVQKLAQREVLINDVAAELNGALDQLLKQNINVRLNRLEAKHSQEGLNREEKELYRDLLEKSQGF